VGVPIDEQLRSDLYDALSDNYHLVELDLGLIDGHSQANAFVAHIAKRNARSAWRLTSKLILDFVLALHSVMDVYTILFVIDQFGVVERAHSQFKKVSYIEQILSSIKRVKL